MIVGLKLEFFRISRSWFKPDRPPRKRTRLEGGYVDPPLGTNVFLILFFYTIWTLELHRYSQKFTPRNSVVPTGDDDTDRPASETAF